MKSRVPGLIKRIVAALSNKTNELRTRVMIFFLLHSNKSLLIDRLTAVVGGPHRRRNAGRQSIRSDGDGGREGESFVMYVNREAAVASVTEATPTETPPHHVFAYTQEYPDYGHTDLTHALFKESEEEMELILETEDDTDQGRDNPTRKNMSTIQEDNNNNISEEDIDHAADLFIERFRRQIQLQKQLSLQESRHGSEALLQGI